MTVTENDAPPRGRVPPHNLDAEQGVLGGMLVSAEIRDRALIALKPESFYRPAHAAAFVAIRAVAQQQPGPTAQQQRDELRAAGYKAEGYRPAVDVLLVVDWLRRNPQGPQPTKEELYSWISDAPMAGTAWAYIEIVHNDARLRRRIHRFEDATNLLYASTDPGDVLAEDHEDLLRAPAESWEPVDLVRVLEDGPLTPEPEWLVRADGHALLYPGKAHMLQGESESGKSWLAIVAVAHCIRSGRDALYLDFEDDARTCVERLAAVGMDAIDLARVVYVRPDEALTDAGRARLRSALERRDIALAVIDGVAEALVMNGWDENAATDVVAFYEALPRMLAKEGIAVCLIDHVVKAKEEQGRYARGSGAKLAGIDGAVYKVETISAFGRGKSGRSRIKVVKDRPGWVRRHAGKSGEVAELVVVSNEDGSVVQPGLVAPTVALGADGQFRPTGLMETVSALLARTPEPMSQIDVARCIHGRREAVFAALRCLVQEGYAEIAQKPGPRGAKMHVHARLFREEQPEPVGGDEP